MKTLRALLLLSCAGVLSSIGSAVAQTSGHHGAKLGTVEFKVDCIGEAQRHFKQGMALYHSYVWSDATGAFQAALDSDPGCGMAHWGRAMSLLDNPFLWPGSLSPQRLDEVAAALQAARNAGLKNARERDYVAALEVFLRDRGKLDHRTRLQSFEDALSQLASDYPEDIEASILFALVTSANFDPKDKTYANQLRAARVLEPLFKAHPDHPGIAHYLIHTYDYAPIAKHGLEAAGRYAVIAPDAPHALHMPSHIFTRVGHWKESIASNRASMKAAGAATFDGHHAADYLVYAHLQLAQPGAARDALSESLNMKPIDHLAAAYAYAAMPARLVLEAGEWKVAASLPLRPSTEAYPWPKYPQAEAINAFARGIGAALSGDADASRREHARLIGLRDRIKIPYWYEQADIQAGVVAALTLCAMSKGQECLDELGRVADREDATEKHVVTPGPILPVREVLADKLLDRNRPDDALAAYEAVLEKEPNRYRALVGAMRAADMAGNSQRAREHARKVAERSSEADARLPSVSEAVRLAAQ
jgi:hypothetical protein